jgi:hypothetical protein
VATLGMMGRASADQPHRAGLIVQFDDGRVETRCIGFDTDEISGAELLARSGLDTVIDASSGLGITVCKIDGLGCDYPAEQCFCQCMSGADCGYWNYFYRDPGETQWSYSALGAVLRKSKPGSVEGWVWGSGNTPPDEAWTFERICPTLTLPVADTPTLPPPMPTPTSVMSVSAVSDAAMATEPAGQDSTAEPEPTGVQTATPLPATPTRAAAPNPDSRPGLSDYWPFGLMIVALIAIAALVRLRRA